MPSPKVAEIIAIVASDLGEVFMIVTIWYDHPRSSSDLPIDDAHARVFPDAIGVIRRHADFVRTPDRPLLFHKD
jgi:hypothetical protein